MGRARVIRHLDTASRLLDRIQRRLERLDMSLCDEVTRDMEAGVALDIGETAQQLGYYAARLRAVHDQIVLGHEQRREDERERQRTRWRLSRRQNGNRGG